MRTGQFADAVRDHVLKNYIEPARHAKAASVQIRAGDVHKALNYRARLPLVCSALTAMSFRRAHNLRLLKVDGPGKARRRRSRSDYEIELLAACTAAGLT